MLHDLQTVVKGLCYWLAGIYFFVVSLSELTEWARLIAAIVSTIASLYTIYYFYTEKKKKKKNETTRN